MRELGRPRGTRPFVGAPVVAFVVRGIANPRPDGLAIAIDGMTADICRDVGQQRRREGRGCGPGVGIAEPGHRGPAMSGEHHGASRLHRQRHDARLWRRGSQSIRQRRDLQPVSAVTDAIRRTAVRQTDNRRIIGARHPAALRPLPPLVHDDAVGRGKRAGADRRVPGARDRVQVRVEAALEDRALVAQPLQPVLPVPRVAIEIVEPHLVDHDDDQQRRSVGRTLRRRPDGTGNDCECQRRQREPPTASHKRLRLR